MSSKIYGLLPNGEEAWFKGLSVETEQQRIAFLSKICELNKIPIVSDITDCNSNINNVKNGVKIINNIQDIPGVTDKK